MARFPLRVGCWSRCDWSPLCSEDELPFCWSVSGRLPANPIFTGSRDIDYETAIQDCRSQKLLKSQRLKEDVASIGPLLGTSTPRDLLVPEKRGDCGILGTKRGHSLLNDWLIVPCRDS